MEKYPLAPLLKVREYREDAAKNALSAAERAVVEAQEAVERCRGELERYKVWRQEEVERRYDAIMGKGLSLKELDVFKAGLGALADGELKLEEAIAQALENVKKRQEDVRKTRNVQGGHNGRFGNGRIQTAAASGDRRRALGAFHPRRGRKHWGKEGKPFWRDVFPIRLPQICRYGSYPALSNAFCVHYALTAFSGIERRLKR